jgi:hypothetical protein
LETKSGEKAKRKEIQSNTNLIDIDVARSERPKIEVTLESSHMSYPSKPIKSSHQDPELPKVPDKRIVAPQKRTVAPPPPPPVLLYLL